MAGDKSASGGPKGPAGTPINLMVKDPERMARNIALVLEGASRAAANFLQPRENGSVSADLVDEINEIVRTVSKVVEYWTADPARSFIAQSRLFGRYFALWNTALARMAGV